jgi:hypothetical protein
MTRHAPAPFTQIDVDSKPALSDPMVSTFMNSAMTPITPDQIEAMRRITAGKPDADLLLEMLLGDDALVVTA